MINRGPDRRAASCPCSFFGGRRAFARRDADTFANGTGEREHAHTISESSCVHARTYAAAEYNSGNTMELGQFCLDARLRSFHLAAPL